MEQYLVQMAYEPAVSALDDPVEAVRGAVKRLGGKVASGWFSVGDYNVVAVVDLPVSEAEQDLSAALTEAEGVRVVQTSRLIPSDARIGMLRCRHGFPSSDGGCEHGL